MKIFYIFVGLQVAAATLSQSDRKHTVKTKVKQGVVLNVFERKLVVPDPHAKNIIAEHNVYQAQTTIKRFKGQVLGYVTPWNNHGYDVAKIFASKFTHISPVWLQISAGVKDKFVFGGTHDIDRSWMDQVRNASSKGIKIVPRLMFEKWSPGDLNTLRTNVNQLQALVQAIGRLAIDHSFDGFVLEIWRQVVTILHPDHITNIIKALCRGLKDKGLNIILVIPTVSDGPGAFTEKHFNNLQDSVDGFSLMTYDFSNPMRPGPNSPLPWVKNCIESLVPDQNFLRNKILTGLNLYGNDFTLNGGGPIINHQYINLLKKVKGKLKYDSLSEENMFEIKDETECKVLSNVIVNIVCKALGVLQLYLWGPWPPFSKTGKGISKNIKLKK